MENTTIERDKFVRRVVKQYSDMVLHVALEYLKDMEKAKDARQDVFEKLLKQDIAHFKDEKHLMYWLREVTKHQSIDTLKLFDNRNTTSLDLVRNFACEEEPEISDDELSVRECMRTLPKVQEEALKLYYWDGLCDREIGEFLGTCKETVRTRIFEGRNRIKRTMLERKHGINNGKAKSRTRKSVLPKGI